jgi:chorismate mutase
MEAKTRKKLEALLWKNTHKDFRGSIDGAKNVLINRGGEGTCLVPLDALTDEELLGKLPKRLTVCAEVSHYKFRNICRYVIEDVVFFETVDHAKGQKFGPFLTVEEAQKANLVER